MCTMRKEKIKEKKIQEIKSNNTRKILTTIYTLI
jgi:hypothetical protein